jgi:hypothetical protein
MLRLRERLHEARRKMMEQATSSNPGNLPVLFTNESALVGEYMRSKYSVRPARKAKIKHGADAWAGRKAADGISLHQQVGGSSDRRQLGRR